MGEKVVVDVSVELASNGAALLTSISEIGRIVVGEAVVVVDSRSELSLDSFDALELSDDDEDDDSSLEAFLDVWTSVEVVVLASVVATSAFVVKASVETSSKEAKAFSKGVVGCSAETETVDCSFGARNGSVLSVGTDEELVVVEASVTGESGSVLHSGFECST